VRRPGAGLVPLIITVAVCGWAGLARRRGPVRRAAVAVERSKLSFAAGWRASRGCGRGRGAVEDESDLASLVARAIVGGGALIAAAGLHRRSPLFHHARAAVDAMSAVARSLRPRAQKFVWRGIYGVSSLGSTAPTFMNYGYAPLDSGVGSGSFGNPDEDTFGTALYDRVAGAADLTDRDVLEVGCGRGGGTSSVFTTHRPRSMVGVDLAGNAVAQARKHFGRPGLEFLQGDAEDLPFPDQSFDVVLNVESCHCYPDVPRFLEEVHRVLRRGGLLLMADLCHTRIDQATRGGLFSHEDVQKLRRYIDRAPFEVLEEEDITANVRLAMQLDSPRRRKVIERRVPRLLQSPALELAGVEGTPLYDALANGHVTYLRLMLRKGRRT
jgi:SAM-dependent methyltransferase